MTTSGNGNASVELSAQHNVLLAVVCRSGAGDNKGVICTPYVYSVAGQVLGFHAISEASPFDAIKGIEMTVDVFYRKL